MKRFLTILLTTLALTAALCVNASASSFDNAANELAKIGMFKGSASGFNLDQVPTRGQAAIMLVRLYGAETQAQNTYRSGRITCPFTDVSETVAPYVAWLADEGIASGTSAATFGASEPCTARAYTIFLLRALGYRDGADFTTGNAQEFAASLGIWDTSALTGTFLRDDLVALTYQALGTDLEDGSTYLLKHLVDEGDIDTGSAYPILQKIEACRDLSASSQSLSKGMAADINMNMALTVSQTEAGNTEPTGRIDQTAVSGKGAIQMVMGAEPQMAMDLTMKVDGESENVKMWMRDGWVYVQSGEDATKTEMGKEYQSLLKASGEKSSNTALLPFLDYITKKTSGGETTYTMELGETFEKLVNGVIAQALKESGIPEGIVGDLNLDGITMIYKVKNGVLKSVSTDTALSLKVNAGDTEGATTTLGMAMNMEMTVTASGSGVKVSYPDFSKFKEAAGPTGISSTLVP